MAKEKKKNRQPPRLPNIPSFFGSFNNETDRAAGILGGALLDLHEALGTKHALSNRDQGIFVRRWSEYAQSRKGDRVVARCAPRVIGSRCD